MGKTMVSLRSDDIGHSFVESQACSRCDACGEEFEKPVLATVSSGYVVKEYYACPRCLSKVGDVESRESKKEKEVQFLEKEVKIEMDTSEKGETCSHELGYLKRRPKNTPIPEECLTCNKMIECLAY